MASDSDLVNGDTIKAEAIQLIESHIDLSEALAELCSVESKGKGYLWGDTIQLADKLDVCPALVATQELVGKLVRGEVGQDDAVHAVGYLESHALLDHRLFTSSLVKSLYKIPLGVICRLLISRHLSISFLLSQMNENNCIDLLLKAFSSEKIPRSLLQDLSQLLVSEVCFPTRTLTSSPPGLTTTTIATFLQHQFSAEYWSESSYTLLNALTLSSSLPLPTLKQLYLDLLIHFVVLSEPTLNYSDAISDQEKWRSSNLPPSKAALFTKLVQQVDHSNVTQCLDRAIAYSTAEVNWDSLLTLVVCYIISSQQAADHFKKYVIDLLAQATTSLEEDLLSACLIFARQGALEGAHVHPPYQKWFQDRFGYCQNSTRKSLHFLLRKLTSLVPFEPAYCLKAHMHGLPRLSVAKAAVSDYTALARARLTELKDTSDSPGTQSADGSALNDVQECVDNFNCTGTIPNKILQASMFQKPYYVNVFLRTLLSPTLPNTVDPSGLIQALAKQNKIPQKMLDGYSRPGQLEGCSQPTLTSPMVERVNAQFQRLVDAVCRGEFPEHGQRLLSKVSATLSSCFADTDVSLLGRELDWLAPNISQHLMQVSDVIINHLCCMVSLKGEHHSACQTTLLMLTTHLILHKPVLVRLWELVHYQLSELTSAQLIGVAKVCYHLWLCDDPLPSLRLYNSQHMLNSWSACCESLLKELTHTTTVQMNSTAQFCCDFVAYSLTHSELHPAKLAPSILLTKLGYLCKRGQELKDKCSGVISKLCDHSQWKAVHVDFVEWLEWELEISEDPLLDWERESYHNEMLFGIFNENNLDMECALCHIYTALTVHHAKPGFTSLIPLLHEICISLPPVADPPSLLKALHKALEQNAEGDGTSQVQNPLIHLRVLSQVPTHLLLTNSLPPKTNYLSNALLTVANCLRILIVHIRDVVMETAFTHYICKCVQSVERSTGDDRLCQQLIQLSPLFHASLTCCWNQLKHIFPSKSLPSIVAVLEWLNCCVGGESPPPPPPQDTPPLVAAAYLLKSTLTGVLLDWRAVLMALSDQVVFILVDFAVRLIAFPALANNLLIDLIEACIARCPCSLTVCSADSAYILAEHRPTITSSREEFPFQCGGNLHHQLSLVLFKVLQHDQVMVDKLVQCSSLDALLPVVVLAHKHCLELASSPHGYQAVECEFIERSTTITKQFIVAASSTTLESYAHLPHSTLNPYITSLTSSSY